MRNMKLIALSLLVALTFSACGKSDQEDKAPTPTPIVDEEAPITEPTQEGDDNDMNGDILGDENENNTDDEILEEAPLVSNEILDELHAAVMEQLGEDYVTDLAYDAAYLEEVYGISPDWYDAAIAYGPMMSVHVDNLVAIHATEGNLDHIYNALNTHRDTLINDKRQYPMNLLKVQGSIVEKVDEYVVFSLLGFVDEMQFEYVEGKEDETDAEIIACYQEINESIIEKAKEIIK